MGNLTAKISGEIASFMSPSVTNIKSLKVHFSPKQLGTGDPSPENVRAIEGWDGVEVNSAGRNLLQNANGKISPLKLKKGTIITASSDEGGYFRGKKNSEWVTPIVWLNKTAKNGRKYTEPYTLPEDIDEGSIFLAIGVSKAQITLDGSIDYKPYQSNTISYQWKLPDEYQEVEYIESTGTQYINLPFGFDRTDEVEARFVLTKVNDDMRDKYIVSPQVWNNDNNRYAMGVHFANNTYNTWTVAFGASQTGNTWLTPVPLATYDFEMHTWAYKNNVFSVEEVGRSRNVSNISFGTTSQPLKLFYGYNSNTAGKIAYYKHKKANGDMYDLVPCYRKSDNEIGMYDTVSQTFYTNQGTGTFLKGNDVDKTFYGGYVDLISGELVEEYAEYTLPNTTNVFKDLENGYYEIGFGNLDGDGYGDAIKNICNILPYGFKTNTSPPQIGFTADYVLSNKANRFHAVIYSNTELTESTVRQWLIDNNFQLVRKIKTPITHQLTPIQLSSFIGQNNFWSNANYVEIEYELKETEDIQKARKRLY